MQYFDPDKNESYIPFVIETSIGVDRMFLQVISASYFEEDLTKEDGVPDSRVVLRLPSVLAPVKLAVLPLVRKGGLPEISRRIIDDLRFDFNCQYDEKDSIGKRYRRQDAIGTPYCITIDYQTIEDNTVTIRYRDTMLQERVEISQLRSMITDKVSLQEQLKKL
jgi:glycyl-tRNA synthetase